MTHACGWKPAPTRANARAPRDRQQFSTAEAFHLIEEVAGMRVPLLALTGGDPLLRPDLFPIIEFASRRSVRTSLTLLPTPTLDPGVIPELKACGLMRVAFWLHGSTPTLNDAHWGMAGLHRRTLEMIGACHEVQLPVQVNTIVGRRNFHDVDSMIELLTRLDVALWNVFFFVPASREESAAMLSAEEHEQVFAKLYAASRNVHFQIKTTEAPHYQRVIQQRERTREATGLPTLAVERRRQLRATRNVGDGNGFVFVDHVGNVCPSGFLPMTRGNVRTGQLASIYRDDPIFRGLRDADGLEGKCGRCEFRASCGGSRSRAYAATGSVMAPDPLCAHVPAA
jgi:radical SAM protein with 4Fe4S-binding SPASM domain